MKGVLKLVNFFLTTLSVDSGTADSGTLTVQHKSVDGYTLEDGEYRFFVVVDLPNKGAREIFAIYKVEGKTLYFNRRISPNGKHNHIKGTLVQINDLAEILNLISQNVDFAGYVEKKTGLVVTVGGGIFRINNVVVTISDKDLTLTDNTKNIIGLDYSDNTVKIVSDSTTFQGSIFAEVTCASGSVTKIDDKRGIDLALNLDPAFFHTSGGKVGIKSGSISATEIKDGAVTSAKIQDSAITSDKLGDNAVTGAKISDGSITAAKIGSGAITTDKLDSSTQTKIQKTDTLQFGGDGTMALFNDGIFKTIKPYSTSSSDVDVTYNSDGSLTKISDKTNNQVYNIDWSDWDAEIPKLYINLEGTNKKYTITYNGSGYITNISFT